MKVVQLRLVSDLRLSVSMLRSSIPYPSTVGCNELWYLIVGSKTGARVLETLVCGHLMKKARHFDDGWLRLYEYFAGLQPTTPSSILPSYISSSTSSLHSCHGSVLRNLSCVTRRTTTRANPDVRVAIILGRGTARARRLVSVGIGC